MRNLASVIFAVLAAAPVTAQDAPENPFSELDLKNPECIRYDKERDTFLVSNVHGKMTATDDNGFITRVEREGPAALKWISGTDEDVTLHAPKGMQIHDGRLYVADIDHLRVFDRETGKPLAAVKIPGAQFLNGVAVVPGGPILVTDSGTKKKPGAIYALTDDGQIQPVPLGGDIVRPNGIDVDSEGRIWVTSFGSKRLTALSLEGEVLGRYTMPAGQLDGVFVLPDGGVMVSSWNGGAVYRLQPGGGVETVAKGLVHPACFDVVTVDGREVLLVPQVKPDRVTVVPVETGTAVVTEDPWATELPPADPEAPSPDSPEKSE